MANEIPQIPLTTPPPSYYPEIPPEPKKSLMRVISEIILAIILILFIGGGISLALRIWDPLWNPFRPSPEKVIEKMQKKMEKVETLHSEIKFDFETKEETKETFKMTMGFRSDSDATDPENLKLAGNFEMAMAFEGMEFSLAADTITIGKDSYFRLITVPYLPFFEMLGISFDELKNQWLKYDKESYLKAIYGGEIPPEMAEEIEKSKEKEGEMTKKLEALFRDKKLYIVKKELPDEKIKDVKVYHYLVALNKEEIKKILPELFKIIQEFSLPGQSLSEKEFEEISPEIDKFFQKIGEITAEIWIAKKDNYLYKIKVEKEIDMSQFIETLKGEAIIKVDIDFSNFNQPVKIEAPKDFKTFEDFEEVLPSMNYPEMPGLPK